MALVGNIPECRKRGRPLRHIEEIYMALLGKLSVRKPSPDDDVDLIDPSLVETGTDIKTHVLARFCVISAQRKSKTEVGNHSDSADRQPSRSGRASPRHPSQMKRNSSS